MNNRNYIYQQIINITPDSFSDGGEISSPLFLSQKFKSFYQSGIRFFDFGAQSTAPTSKLIGLSEEIERIKNFISPLLSDRSISDLLNHSMLSFDTFRIETIDYLLKLMRENSLTPNSIFWNDVSGVMDEHSFSFLELTKRNKLILCHNLAGSRENAASHFKFESVKKEKDFLYEVVDYFHRKLECIPNNLRRQVILDPAFGFSKNDGQNMFLLKNLSLFVNEFPKEQQFLFGISRKRFLRNLSGININELSLLDDYQDRLFEEFLPNNNGAVWYLRCHRCLAGKNYLI